MKIAFSLSPKVLGLFPLEEDMCPFRGENSAKGMGIERDFNTSLSSFITVILGSSDKPLSSPLSMSNNDDFSFSMDMGENSAFSTFSEEALISVEGCFNDFSDSSWETMRGSSVTVCKGMAFSVFIPCCFSSFGALISTGVLTVGMVDCCSSGCAKSEETFLGLSVDDERVRDLSLSSVSLELEGLSLEGEELEELVKFLGGEMD
ncbi:MAG: hypothetical protein H0X26_09745 [Alphaproteobacteria bacterium]|nr:hypothetical protein [Alphaproteobacteria bacterium]